MALGRSGFTPKSSKKTFRVGSGRYFLSHIVLARLRLYVQNLAICPLWAYPLKLPRLQLVAIAEPCSEEMLNIAQSLCIYRALA